jgi:hypothetical protein
MSVRVDLRPPGAPARRTAPPGEYGWIMGNVDGARPEQEPDAAPEKEPPLQVLFPNLDHMSRSSFSKGTVSRRRINRALVVLALIPIVVLVVIFLLQFVS